MKCMYALDIHAPIETVFEWIHNPDKHPLWLQGVEETRYVNPYDPANPIGARFTQKIREGRRVKEYDGEVTAFARPKHLGVRLFSPQFSVQVDYRLTPMARGTRLDYTADVQCGSRLFRLMSLLLRPFMKGMVRRRLSKLKELAEKNN